MSAIGWGLVVTWTLVLASCAVGLMLPIYELPDIGLRPAWSSAHPFRQLRRQAHRDRFPSVGLPGLAHGARPGWPPSHQPWLAVALAYVAIVLAAIWLL